VSKYRLCITPKTFFSSGSNVDAVVLSIDDRAHKLDNEWHFVMPLRLLAWLLELTSFVATTA